MTPKHTPGPWHLVREGVENEDYHIKSTATEQTVMCYGISRDYPIGSDDWNRSLADANVMTDAPALLNLVMQVLTLADKYQQRGVLTPEGDLKRWLVEARSIVARATGEQPT